MASPQLKNGYLQIANELFEALCRIRLNGEAMRVFFFVMRKTYGYKKKHDLISTSQIMEGTGLNRRSVERGRSRLKEMNMINTVRTDGTNILQYSIQKDYEKWKLPSKLSAPTKSRQCTVSSDARIPSNLQTTKYSKDTLQKITGSEALQAVLNKVRNVGLNIDALIRKCERERNLREQIPEQVIMGVCNEYLRQKDQIRDVWPWFITIFRKESEKYFAQKNIEEHQAYKNQQPVSLGEILQKCAQGVSDAKINTD